MNKQIKVSFFFTLIATGGLGIVYPLLLASIGFFIPSASHPSLLMEPIQSEDLFQGRPSMSGGPYSGASNLSLANPELWKQVEERLKQLSPSHLKGVFVPRDLLFASASGYDPDISAPGAMHQIPRIARAWNMNVALVKQVAHQHIQPKLWGFIGAEKVNVMELNKSLEQLNARLTPSSERRMFRIKQ